MAVCAVCGKVCARANLSVMCCVDEADDKTAGATVVNDWRSRLGVNDFIAANKQMTQAAEQWYRSHAATTFDCCLHPKGVVDVTTCSFLACGLCERQLNAVKPVPPSFALSNNFWFGALPDDLPELTVPEQLAICQHHIMSCIIELQQAEGVARRHRGNCIAFAQDVTDIAVKLPRSRQDLAGMVQVVCVIRPERLDDLLEAAFRVVDRHIGVVTVSDCEVLRAERF